MSTNPHTPTSTPTATDSDPQETQEWRDAFAALLAAQGPERARYVLDELARQARTARVGWQPELCTPYINTLGVDQQPQFPGDLAVEEHLAGLMRWNALVMVVRANQAYGELGGHIASYASAADLFETGFNHFFHAREAGKEGGHGGDLVFFQPHSSPGVYARAYLEGRLTEDDLKHYRQELTAPAARQAQHALELSDDEGSNGIIGHTQPLARGLCSYPHPYLMPGLLAVPHRLHGAGGPSAPSTTRASCAT